MVEMATIEADQHYKNVKQQVMAWHRTMLCQPSWDEVREFHAIMVLGYYTMSMKSFEPKIQVIEKGYVKALEWIARCKQHGIWIFGIYDTAAINYETEYGPRDVWPLEPASAFTDVNGSIVELRQSYRKNLREATKEHGSTTEKGKIRS